MSLDPIVWLVVFIISITMHEAAHALAAFWGGDRTAYREGQVSLNPWPHLRREPFGMGLMPVLTAFSWGFPIGWASTPYDPAWAQRYPRRAAWMAAAGPGANLLLALIALALLHFGLAAGAFDAPDSVSFSRMVIADGAFLDNVGRFLTMTLVLNTILCVFNLIPFPPLDGAAVITLVLPEDLALRLGEALGHPALSMGGLLLAWYAFPQVVGPIWEALLVLLHPSVSYS